MQKNDLYLLAAVILVWGCFEIVALKLAGATGSDVAAWVQAIGTVGAVGAAIYWARREEHGRAEKVERTATLIVAAQTADWLRTTVERIAETRLAIASNGHQGQMLLDVAEFAFTNNLAIVADLTPRLAVVALRLKETRERLNSLMMGDFDGEDEAINFAFREVPKLFARVREFYWQIAAAAHIPGDPNQRWEIDQIVAAWNSTCSQGSPQLLGSAEELDRLLSISMRV
ncbi:MAG: hypothetical protein ISS15_05420 [Alphaproteobacteria bacterium]|nr:hypothetical protein [Alphaproteobacteria bacterium]MBL6939440.1 hypothetical protein [Alphaproteobacteria bacterium]MBL7097079.1 hypothetical protein [Alphaproteobacteria bacterium]